MAAAEVASMCQFECGCERNFFPGALLIKVFPEYLGFDRFDVRV
jgi:hypothetical protein